MRAGRLRHRVAHQRTTNTTNSHGDTVEGWATAATIWASVDTIRGGEREHIDQTQGELDSKITYRSKAANVSPGDRFAWSGRFFNVVYIDSFDNRGIMRVAYCKEQVPA